MSYIRGINMDVYKRVHISILVMADCSVVIGYGYKNIIAVCASLNITQVITSIELITIMYLPPLL